MQWEGVSQKSESSEPSFCRAYKIHTGVSIAPQYRTDSIENAQGIIFTQLDLFRYGLSALRKKDFIKK